MTNPNFCIVLVDLTTDKTPDVMRPAAHFSDMIAAWLEQINNEFSFNHGSSSVFFRISTDPLNRSPVEIAMNFRDTIPEVPDALAYHQVVNGVPDIEIGVDLFDSLTDGYDPVSVGGGHEILELIKDAGANGWKDKQDNTGFMCAEEMCDVVQNVYYAASNGILLPNFLLPSYFIPGAPGPWDYRALMTGRDDMSNGYEIRAAAPGTVTTVSARSMRGMHLDKHRGMVVFMHGSETLNQDQLKRKSHRFSRTHRRGVRL